MAESIFVAGATGVIGSVLVKLLLQAGYRVYGSTRRKEQAQRLRSLGVSPVVVDVFDAQALEAQLLRIKPDCVVHQLTDLPRGLDPTQMAEAIARNARLRDQGTANLMAAARASGCERVVAQSIAWAYAEGPMPYAEEAALDLQAQGLRAISVGGVAALEHRVLNTPSVEGTVLRYGQLYGPGTGTDQPSGTSPLHVEAAAWAALLALRLHANGVFNIAEDNPQVSTEKARRMLGWTPDLRA